VLALYEELAGTLAHLVALARDRQWQHLPALDARCCALAAQLRAAEPQRLPPDELTRVIFLASRIRGDQEALATLVQPQFLQLISRLRSAYPDLGDRS
jgi:flagellar protein FliT